MNLSTFDEGAQFGQESLAIDPASLYREFEKVKDGRGKKGIRFPLPFVLTLIMRGIDGWSEENQRNNRLG
jgi:hypothetical protein